METGNIQKLENLLLVAIPRDLMDEEVLRLRREVSQEVRRHHSRWVLLDFSQVDICDSFFGRFIESMANMVGLMGAEVIVSGLQDAVVETLVELGMTLAHIRAVLDLDEALAMSREIPQQTFFSPGASTGPGPTAVNGFNGNTSLTGTGPAGPLFTTQPEV